MKSDVKKPYRKRYLFPRSLHEVVQQATKPIMDAQGKLYGALMRDWAQIVGEKRAAITTPQRIQFPTQEAAGGAILHLDVHPSHAPEMQYATAQILEQCARYFGYKAIDRIVLHADYAQLTTAPEAPKKPEVDRVNAAEAKAMFAAMRAGLNSGDDK